MNLYEYRQAVALWKSDPSFYALIMAAMYRADSDNAQLLAEAFPDTWAEVNARYHAPGGVLPSDESPDAA